MRIRSPGGLAAAVALCFVGVSIVRNHQQRSSDLAEIKGKIAKLNTRTGQTSAKAPAKGTPRPKQTGDGSDGSAITLLGSNPMVQVNDQITNFQTLMLNIDNPDVDKGRKNEFRQYMSYWEEKRKNNELGSDSPMHATPLYHDYNPKTIKIKKFDVQGAKNKADPLAPSTCFQSAKCDVLGDMAQHGEWKVNEEFCTKPHALKAKHYMCTKKNEIWVPKNKKCGKLCGYTPAEACRVLGRSKEIIIAGDSLMRQLYQAMACIVSNDYQHGSLKKHLWKALDEQTPILSKRKWCKGKDVLWCSYTNTLELKTNTLDGNPCGGNVTVEYNASPSRATKEHADYVIYMLNKLRPTDVVIFGAGLWQGLETDNYIKNFLTPIMDRATDPNWKDRTPLIVWIPPHTTFYPRPASKIDPKHLYDFSVRTAAYVRSRGVPVFETINLGLDVPYESYDGLHFVGAVNLHKASLLLRYLESLHIERERRM